MFDFTEPEWGVFLAGVHIRLAYVAVHYAHVPASLAPSDLHRLLRRPEVHAARDGREPGSSNMPNFLS